MTPRSLVSSSPIVATLALGALLTVPVMAQYSGTGGGGRRSGPLANNRIRLTQFSVEPGATLPAGGNQVLVYLTADPDGRFPAEAVWQAAGGSAVQNRGPARLDAISIELKDVQGTSSGTPPEALDAQYGVEVTRLIDNPRVLVTKHRYGPTAYGSPLHFHGEDVYSSSTSAEAIRGPSPICGARPRFAEATSKSSRQTRSTASAMPAAILWNCSSSCRGS